MDVQKMSNPFICDGKSITKCQKFNIQSCHVSINTQWCISPSSMKHGDGHRTRIRYEHGDMANP